MERTDQAQQQHFELQRLPSMLLAPHLLHENFLVAINAGGKGTQFTYMERHFRQDPSLEFKLEGIGNYCRGVMWYLDKPDEHQQFQKYVEHIEPHLPKMKKGDLLPDSNIISVVRLAYADQVGHIYATGAERQLVLGWDGWPRTEEQYDESERMREELAKKGIDAVRSWVYMELPDRVVMARTWNRVVQKMLSREGFLPSNFHDLSESAQRTMVLDNFRRAVTEIGVRPDDHPNTIPNRIETFKKETLPVIDRAAKDYGIITVNGDQEELKVHADIVPHLTPKIPLAA